MKRPRLVISLLFAVTFSCFLLIASAKGSLLPAVPDSVPDPPRSALQEKRVELQSRLDSLNQRTDKFNVDCNSVLESSAKARECKEEQSSIRNAKSELLKAISDFKRELQGVLARDDTSRPVASATILESGEDLKDAVAASPSATPNNKKCDCVKVDRNQIFERDSAGFSYIVFSNRCNRAVSVSVSYNGRTLGASRVEALSDGKIGLGILKKDPVASRVGKWECKFLTD